MFTSSSSTGVVEPEAEPKLEKGPCVEDRVVPF